MRDNSGRLHADSFEACSSHQCVALSEDLSGDHTPANKAQQRGRGGGRICNVSGRSCKVSETFIFIDRERLQEQRLGFWRAGQSRAERGPRADRWLRADCDWWRRSRLSDIRAARCRDLGLFNSAAFELLSLRRQLRLLFYLLSSRRLASPLLPAVDPALARRR
eukprot:superscaffoldBa00003601_g17295